MSIYKEVLKLPKELDESRLLLFDGHSIAFRSYYAIRELTTKAGRPVNAAFGFWRAILKTLRDYPSAYAAVAFDAGGETFRHRMYPDYKATRKPTPEDLREQIPLMQKLLEALGIPVYCEEGVEADDVLGTLACRAASAGLNALIVTSDKDMAQVVNERISILRPSGRGTSDDQQLLDPAGVQAKYGVRPDQIVDLLSLIGDSSDNVPGVPSVGEKTARKLLETYDSLDAILERADEVKNERVRRNLQEYQENAHLARRLIRLDCNVSVGELKESCRLSTIDTDKLAAFFAEVEFGSALLETQLQAPGVKDAESTPPTDADYRTVLQESELETVLEELREAKAFAIDLETTGTDPMSAQIVGIALSSRPLLGYYVPIGHDALGSPEQLPLELVLNALKPLVEDEQYALCGQNLKYDIVVLANYGVEARGIAFDSMIASHLAAPEQRRHNLETIAETYLGCRVATYADVAGKDGAFSAVPVEAATAYAAEDAEIVQRLRGPLTEAIEASGVETLFREVEIPLIPVLARMERAGILVDPNELEAQGRDLRKELEIVEADLFEIADCEFNPNSPKQVAEILFERLGLPVIDRTKSGPSTSAQVLSELASLHPFPGKLMAHRELRKLLTTYIDQLPKAINERTGRIHTSFHQASTATGRLSSSDPNLQNIPTRTEIGGRIRRAFVAPKGSVLLAADYSQIELRLLAHFSKDQELLRAFEEGADLHTLTASRVFDVSEAHITAEQRAMAKRINFGILYGISPYGLGRDLGIPQSEAKAFIDRFFGAYPQAKQTLDDLVEKATRKGYAETILGRRRPLPNLRSRNASQRNFDRRNAVNTPIQGSAADLIKLAMLRIDREIEEGVIPARMLLQIHDELVFEVERENCERALAPIIDAMETVLALDVKPAVKTTVGDNWSEV